MNTPTSDPPANAAAASTAPKPTGARPPATASPPSKSAKRANAIAKRQKKETSVRPGSKTAKILCLLKRPSGASVTELRKATGWQPHSVRDFLSGTLKKKMGLRVHSAKRDSGERFYRITVKK